MTTPSERAFAALGGEVIVAALVARASTELGKARCAEPVPVERVDEAERLLDETAAMDALIEKRPDFDIEPAADVTPLLTQAVKGRPLTGAGLRGIVPVLTSAERIAFIFRATGVADDETNPLGEGVEAPAGLAGLIDDAVDDAGSVRSDATPEIARLHKQVNQLTQGIRAKAEAMLKEADVAPMLQDDYVTLRDNRFVLPVRAEHKRHLEGIVHGASATGQTFYIEPRALVEMNNRLREAEAELESAIHRLLVQLTVMVAEEADTIAAAQRGLTRLDVIHARARLSRDIGGVRPVFDDRVALTGAANPVMLLEGKKVVRSELVMPEGVSCLIISGPNAGGKTVAMGGVGLAALMARLGLYVAAGEGSRIPFYGSVHADIGDSQSIHDDLSTFSAHLTAINRVLLRTGPGALVLLDELMVSTDPREGAALAVAVLDRLVAVGCHVVVTTHFADLKILAQSQAGFYNLSMEFDELNGAPTYRVIAGAPGSSSALALAERLGMDPTVVAAARARLEGGDERIEQALGKLREQATLADRYRREAEEAKRAAARLKEEAAALKERIVEEREEMAKTAKRKLAVDVADARRRLNEMVEAARRAGKDKQALGRAKEEVERIAADVRTATAPDEAIPRNALKKGDRVYVIPLQTKGTLSADPTDGKAEVDVGGLRTSVALADLIGIGREGGGSPKVSTPQPRRSEPAPGRAIEEIDLRGMRAEAALEKVERVLDRLITGDTGQVRIIHGKGTGALRMAVREYLAASAYVTDFVGEEDPQGGDGATLVTLRR